MRKLARSAAVVAAVLGAGCGGGSRSNAGGTVSKTVKPPVVAGSFTYYSVDQGLPPDVRDVSADEAGNVYVAAVSTVLAKKRDDRDFHAFDPAAVGLTRNCDEAQSVVCNLVSIAGAAPGVAIVGLQGIGTDGDADPNWELDSGGADVLAFDGTKLTRTRHVQIAGAPQQMCMDHSAPPCSTGDPTYVYGRRKVRQVLRMAVNHAKGTLQYGDVWFAGTHGTFSLLVANAAQRGWTDLTLQYPGTQDRQFVWEHDHPAMYEPATINGTWQWAYLTGESTAIAIDPTTGDPWASNETRTASKKGYGAVPNGWDLGMWPYPNGTDDRRWWLDVWPDPLPTDITQYDALDPAYADFVSSLSFCDDGTLWIASSLHGLARRAASGAISYVALPPGLGDDASAVACDPSDGSVWVGFGWGGFGRLRPDGSWWLQDATAPAYALGAPVANIQIDRWASPRIVYIAQQASARNGPGGVTVYDGP